MRFRGKEVLNWSLNNYLGLANHPEVRKADAQAASDFGMAYPMGARMMSGNTTQHETLEADLAAFDVKLFASGFAEVSGRPEYTGWQIADTLNKVPLSD